MCLRSCTIFEFASTLRSLLVLALIFALNTAHVGMSSQAHGMSMTQYFNSWSSMAETSLSVDQLFRLFPLYVVIADTLYS